MPTATSFQPQLQQQEESTAKMYLQQTNATYSAAAAQGYPHSGAVDQMKVQRPPQLTDVSNRRYSDALSTQGTRGSEQQMAPNSAGHSVIVPENAQAQHHPNG